MGKYITCYYPRAWSAAAHGKPLRIVNATGFKIAIEETGNYDFGEGEESGSEPIALILSRRLCLETNRNYYSFCFRMKYAKDCDGKYRIPIKNSLWLFEPVKEGHSCSGEVIKELSNAIEYRSSKWNRIKGENDHGKIDFDDSSVKSYPKWEPYQLAVKHLPEKDNIERFNIFLEFGEQYCIELFVEGLSICSNDDYFFNCFVGKDESRLAEYENGSITSDEETWHGLATYDVRIIDKYNHKVMCYTGENPLAGKEDAMRLRTESKGAFPVPEVYIPDPH